MDNVEKGEKGMWRTVNRRVGSERAGGPEGKTRDEEKNRSPRKRGKKFFKADEKSKNGT
jgi:hypothetical protein